SAADTPLGNLKDRSSCSRKTSCSVRAVRTLSAASSETRRNSDRVSSCSHVLTRTNIATNSAKKRTMGKATGSRRLRHRSCGSPTITRINGSTSTTPRVSPSHQETQFINRSERGTTPSAERPANDKVALVRQKMGDTKKNRVTSRTLSRGVG